MFDIPKVMSKFNGTSVVDYRNWEAKLRVILQTPAHAVLEILDGKQPPGEGVSSPQ